MYITGEWQFTLNVKKPKKSLQKSQIKTSIDLIFRFEMEKNHSTDFKREVEGHGSKCILQEMLR